MPTIESIYGVGSGRDMSTLEFCYHASIRDSLPERIQFPLARSNNIEFFKNIRECSMEMKFEVTI
ncbi:hypothetical protein C0J52_13837 [Blattella germanica]|nr:hypothetical protein C0J52_13837 [Blattella germanica]